MGVDCQFGPVDDWQPQVDRFWTIGGIWAISKQTWFVSTNCSCPMMIDLLPERHLTRLIQLWWLMMIAVWSKQTHKIEQQISLLQVNLLGFYIPQVALVVVEVVKLSWLNLCEILLKSARNFNSPTSFEVSAKFTFAELGSCSSLWNLLIRLIVKFFATCAILASGEERSSNYLSEGHDSNWNSAQSRTLCDLLAFRERPAGRTSRTPTFGRLKGCSSTGWRIISEAGFDHDQSSLTRSPIQFEALTVAAKLRPSIPINARCGQIDNIESLRLLLFTCGCAWSKVNDFYHDAAAADAGFSREANQLSWVSLFVAVG